MTLSQIGEIKFKQSETSTFPTSEGNQRVEDDSDTWFSIIPP